MKTFHITGLNDPEGTATDRQERISWWSQERVSRAKVMVVGAGAIGNETLKNLALLGFQYIFVADFDVVSRSNLSRTVLFRKTDIGLKKAEVAARRVREMAVADNFQIDWFHGDIVWELGLGIYQEMDIVLGCLDNVETRLAVNRQCWLSGKPWIDAGTHELGCRVNIYRPLSPPCYECGLSHSELAASRTRFSCDQFKLTMAAAGKVPTVQVASALVSALQVQEAVKLLCGEPAAEGKKLYFQGKTNDFDLLTLPVRDNCQTHNLTYPDIISLPLGCHSTLGEFLQAVSQAEWSGPEAELTLKSLGQHQFIESAPCRACERPVEFFRPHYRIGIDELLCGDCKSGKKLEELHTHTATQSEVIEHHEFSLKRTPSRLLGMTLHAMGFQYGAVLTVRDTGSGYAYYLLHDDCVKILPSLPCRDKRTLVRADGRGRS